MPEETGRVVAVQAEVQYQPTEIAGQCANRRRYLGRDVTMVLGREDSGNASLLLETGPEAMSQGAEPV